MNYEHGGTILMYNESNRHGETMDANYKWRNNAELQRLRLTRFLE